MTSVTPLEVHPSELQARVSSSMKLHLVRVRVRARVRVGGRVRVRVGGRVRVRARVSIPVVAPDGLRAVEAKVG